MDTQSIIEKAVGEVLEGALPGLRAQIVSRAIAELKGLVSAGSSTELLDQATAAIQETTAQGEILRQLLEGGSRFAGRVALFVVKSGAITGWQAVGFDANDLVKSANLNDSSGLVAQAMQARAPVEGSAAEFDAAFLSMVGRPTGDRCLVLPLIVKEKIAALVYADRGASPEDHLDGAALKVLTRCAALWLDLVAIRKSGAVPAEEPQSTVPAPPERSPAVAAAAAPATSDESDFHRKAKRFAKLLVEEIKLYNQSKVAEGRQQADLYERLREDIEKSRATYDKRYGESLVASANYFDEELIRILADNDVRLMGAGFPR
ncbi:MAG TPA: hypothetical protein VF532_22380 [Candidatus Angelobacter sp.]